jgi:hypothetical protein
VEGRKLAEIVQEAPPSFPVARAALVSLFSLSLISIGVFQTCDRRSSPWLTFTARQSALFQSAAPKPASMRARLGAARRFFLTVRGKRFFFKPAWAARSRHTVASQAVSDTCDNVSTQKVIGCHSLVHMT